MSSPQFLRIGRRHSPIKQERWWSRYARVYDSLWAGDLSDILARAVVAHAGPTTGLTVDIGCGTGLISQHLVHNGHRVVCVDQNAAMLRRLTERLPGTWVALGSVDDLPLRPHSAHTVIATNLLHLHPEPVRAFARLVDLLVPSGRLLCSWPRDDAGPWRVAVAEHRAGLGAGRIAARTCGRIVTGLLAPRPSRRIPVRTLMDSIVDFTRRGALTLDCVDLPDAEQTLVVLGRAEP